MKMAQVPLLLLNSYAFTLRVWSKYDSANLSTKHLRPSVEPHATDAAALLYCCDFSHY